MFNFFRNHAGKISLAFLVFAVGTTIAVFTAPITGIALTIVGGVAIGSSIIAGFSGGIYIGQLIERNNQLEETRRQQELDDLDRTRQQRDQV